LALANQLPLPAIVQRGRSQHRRVSSDIEESDRGGWTQIFGGKGSEPVTFKPVKNAFYLPTCIGAPVIEGDPA